jgi:hypothetical protein
MLQQTPSGRLHPIRPLLGTWAFYFWLYSSRWPFLWFQTSLALGIVVGSIDSACTVAIGETLGVWLANAAFAGVKLLPLVGGGTKGLGSGISASVEP